MKKMIATSLVLCMSVGMLAGCGGTSSSSNSDAGSTTTESASQEKSETPAATETGSTTVTLSVMDSYASESPHGELIYQYADAFMAQNPEVTIDIQAIPSGDISTKISAMATTPNDLPTIFFIPSDQAAIVHELGITEDLFQWVDDATLDSFANGVVESCMLEDEMVYFPVAVQPQGVIYRMDRFEEKGIDIPTTWQEFEDVSIALSEDTDGDGELDHWGFSMIGSNNSSGQSRFMSYLWSNGYEMVYHDGSKWATDLSVDPEFIEVFSKWTNMSLIHNAVPIGISEVDYPTAANYFAMGYTDMFLTGTNALGVAYSSNPDLEGKLGSFKLPGDYPGTLLGTEGYVVCNTASEAEKAAAVAYLTFINENDATQAFWQSSGKIPVTLEGQSVDFITGEDYAGYLQQIEDGCRDAVTFPGVGGLKTALGDAYAVAFSKEMTNEEAVAKLVRDVEELLTDYN